MNTRTMHLLLMVLLVTGCAARPVWVQEGKTDAETQRDFNDCYAQAKQRFGTNLESPLFTTHVTQCMESRGYKQLRIEDRTPKPLTAPAQPGM